MDQDFNNNQNEILWALLANPASDVRLYTYNLQRLVNDFPQSGILQALLAHASDEKNLRQASAYFNAKSLYKLINAPSTLVGVPVEKIFIQSGIQKGIQTNGHYQPKVYSGETLVEQPEQNVDGPTGDPYLDDNFVAETGAETVTGLEEHQHSIDHEAGLALSDEATGERDITEAIPEIAESVSKEPVENIVNETHEAVAPEDVPTAIETELTHEAVAGDEETGEAIEDRFDEIRDLVSPEETSQHEPEIIHPTAAESWEDDAEETHEAVSAEEQSTQLEPELIHQAAAESYEAVENTIEEIHEEVPREALPSHHEPELINDDVTENIETVESAENKEAETYEAASSETTSTLHEPESIVNTIAEKEEQDEPVHDSEVAEAAAEGPETIEIARHEPEKLIDEEIFDEIAGVEEINTASEEQAPAAHEEIAAADEKPEPVTADAELEKLIPESIASTDFFMFDKAFGQHKKDDSPDTLGEGSDTTGDNQDVSRYNDEKMPYTFMWWLDKTRKEHAAIYQPYVNSEAVNLNGPKRGGDELQQQYFENIFHITSVDELDKGAPPLTAPYNVKRKEQVIIERFIKEEPQIKPQSSDKIDNENKAKKSSEDRDELVTETLAVIYSEQMLYHKAIACYKKLMLKFPEKSRYFADKIEQLEKKTN